MASFSSKGKSVAISVAIRIGGLFWTLQLIDSVAKSLVKQSRFHEKPVDVYFARGISEHTLEAA